MDHVIKLSWALAKDPVYPFRGPISTSGFDQLRSGAFRQNHAAYRLEVHNDGWSWAKGAPSSTAKDLIAKGYYGEELQTKLQFQLSRQVTLASLVEQLPSARSKIVPSLTEKDALGIARPEVHYELSLYEKTGLKEAELAHQYVFDNLGVLESYHHAHYFGAGHIMGTYRMGLDPKTSVVDKNLVTHDHKNLYLLGSGVFPTGGTANPTLTIVALTLKSLSHLLASC
jgi:choline dehydrogenase-like flavoprotein